MPAIAFHDGEDVSDTDDRVLIYNVSWLQYETMLGWRGDKSVPRYAYLRGTLEVRSPSRNHERIKSFIGCIVEAYMLAAGVEFSPVGSWTLRDCEQECGIEPDECYIIGDQDTWRPDLAIEVAMRRGGINKLEIYRELAIPEVWIVRDGAITVYVLEGDAYTHVACSQAFPKLDLVLVMKLVDEPSASRAMQKMTAWAVGA